MTSHAPAWGTEGSDILCLVNTRVDTGSAVVELLPTEESARSWCRERGLSSAAASGADAVRMLRDDARDVLRHVIEERPLPAALLGRVNRAAGAPVRIGLDKRAAMTWDSEDGTGTDALARELVLLASSPQARALRICAAPDCDRMFVQDHGRRIWCCTPCGNRTRARRHAAGRA